MEDTSTWYHLQPVQEVISQHHKEEFKVATHTPPLVQVQSWVQELLLNLLQLTSTFHAMEEASPSLEHTGLLCIPKCKYHHFAKEQPPAL